MKKILTVFLSLLAVVGVHCVTLPNGRKALAPKTEQTLLDAELALCDVLLPMGLSAAGGAIGGPVGAVVGGVSGVAGNFACQGSEAAMRAGLDRVTAQTTPAPAAMTHPLLKTPKGYAVFAGKAQIGCVPTAAQAAAFHTPDVQAHLANVPAAAQSALVPPADAGVPAVVVPSLVPFATASAMPSAAPASAPIPAASVSAAPAASSAAPPPPKPSVFMRARAWLHKEPAK